ncbi:MAG: UDP-glucose/GDP-mannose dehydrogenase family protein [Clostridia bacterium]|nr:UDP-glucose/GDP-mannose dehydrogenase family protein [Clostridia bacterium]
MNISVIGVGYVGLVTGACLSEFGINALCMDIDEEKINKLKKGIIPIYEPDLAAIVHKNSGDKLHFTTSMEEAVAFADVIFIAVDTPTREDGTSDLTHVFEVARNIALYMNEYKIIVNKSTVPVFTGQKVREEIKAILAKEGKNFEFDVVSNPEFLQEGSAVKNFICPDRIVIGSSNDKALEAMKKVYYIQLLQGVPLVATNIETAEMIKYASNAFLATKVSFINEMANMCERCNADVLTVARAMGLDDRIGPRFLQPGPGYGGSCFPKDTKALVGIGKKIRYIPKIVKSVIEVNRLQRLLAYSKIKKAMKKLDNKTVTVLGLSFKPETDDLRESPAIDIIEKILESNARVKVYDPKSMSNMKTNYPLLPIAYCEDAYSACAGSDCIVLVTDWKEFKSLDFEKLKEIVQTPVFVDLRNVYEPEEIRSFGFRYEGMGRK